MPSLPRLALLSAAVSLVLSACQYPSTYRYHDAGAYRGTFTPLRVTGGGLLSDAAASCLGSTHDHYYYMIRGADAGKRVYGGTTAGRAPLVYQRSYYLHPYYSNSLSSSPYYSRSPSYAGSLTNRPWGGGYGFGQPFNWGVGLALGSRWF